MIENLYVRIHIRLIGVLVNDMSNLTMYYRKIFSGRRNYDDSELTTESEIETGVKADQVCTYKHNIFLCQACNYHCAGERKQ